MEDRVKTAIENLSALVAEFDADDAAISRLILEAIEEIRDSATDKMAALLDKVEGAVVDICAGETDFAAAYEALVSAVGAVQKEQECGGNAEDKPAMPAEDLFEVEIQHDVLSGLIEQAGPSNDHVTGVCGDLFEKIAAVKTLPGSLRKKIGYIVETISSRSYESGPFEALAARMEEAVAEVGRTLKEAKRTIDAESKFVDDEDLTSVFLERQQAALNEFESDILKVEKGDAVAALDVATTVGRLAEETSALGMKEAAVFLERLSGLMGTEPPSAEKKKIDALLVLKDILQEHFDALSEGREGKIDAARAESVAVAFRTGQARPVVRTEHGSAKRIAPKVVVDASNPDFPEFIAETRDYIQAAEAAMISLEKNPDDKECLNEIFRCFHNVKGISGFFSLTDVNELSHNAETLLDKARKGAMEFTSECAAASFEALDMLKEMLERVERALGGGAYNSPERWAELINRLEMIAAGQTPPEAQRAIPAETKPRPAAETAAQEDSAGENVVASVGPADLSANGASNQNAGMVKVSTKRLDSLIDAVGELVIANAMVTQRLELKNTIDADLARNVNQLNKITRELQELAMSMRMVSLKSVFQKMARVARDTSIKAGVPMEFSFSGEDTELDRNVVEEISSPLVHMVRNAVDHGIEPSEERMRLGKPPIGKIKLSAFHEGGGVIIRIEDDGRGLDRERIIEKARRLGMVRPDAELSDREA
ncbi:MAG TPA: Hpt domain-containing protein, partial [bacterium]|nr:Hpt domain-containing protein [bacterium]